MNEENNRSWRKKLDSAYRKQDALPNFSGGSQTLVLIKIIIILIKYYGMNSSSVFIDIGSGQSKPGLVARQIANGPTVVVGIENLCWSNICKFPFNNSNYDNNQLFFQC